MDVLHETIGRDGLASWFLAVDTEWVPWGPTSGQFSFDTIVHQVRHPLHVIAFIENVSACIVALRMCLSCMYDAGPAAHAVYEVVVHMESPC